MNKSSITFFLLCLWLFQYTTLKAQEIFTGLKFDDEQYNSEFRIARGLDFTDLDNVPSISLQSYAPESGNQGNFNSCVSWATAYAALTIYNHVAGNKIAPRSPWFVFNQITNPSNCNTPTSIGQSLKLLQQKGDCAISEFTPSNCETLPSDTLELQAAPYKIKDYYTLFSFNDVANVKIQNTIRSLSSKKCVIIGMNIYKNFIKLDKSGTYIPIVESGDLGGHAMCVTGFNKAKKQFQILNSWGGDWGNKGYCYISFDDYAKFTRYGYCLNIASSRSLNFTDESNLLEGEFIFKKLMVTNNEYIFHEVTPSFTNGVYTLQEKCSTKDFYKLIVQQVKENTYLYIFSIKPDQSVELLFPKSGKDWDSRDMPIMPSGKIKVLIPENPDNAFTTDKVGTDYLCILFSDQRIDSMPEKLKQLETLSGEISDRLQVVFNSLLVPAKDIVYSKQRMKAEVKNSDAHIVPILLKVQVDE